MISSMVLLYSVGYIFGDEFINRDLIYYFYINNDPRLFSILFG